jgi:hypothetical protein
MSRNLPQHSRKGRNHFVIADSQYAQTHRREDSVAFRVAHPVFFMDGSVDFHNQRGRVAVEVSYEPGNNLLAAKMKYFERTSTQRLPQQTLRRCHRTAQFFGEIGLRASNGLPGNDTPNSHFDPLILRNTISPSKHYLPFPSGKERGLGLSEQIAACVDAD